MGAWRMLSSASSPGSPMMMWPPVRMPRAWVRSTARRLQAKSWPRLMRRKGLVVGALDAVFHEEEGLAVELLQVIEQLVAHTVGAGADDDAHHVGHCQCLLIHPPQFVHLCVGIRIGLEISQVSHVGIFSREERLALLQLLCDRLPAVAIAGIEGAVVAVCATARGDLAVPVGTGESRVYRDLLHSKGKPAANPRPEIVVIPHHLF